ncbi:flavocytochrome c [Acetonema longum]|uniref:Putative fumarate reductase flavoprotein subunit n=1 Tax=Acetonema longum DSM 6540 TaxID=1009370 RepID=F7NG64_9FIRM|nr:flavocytochrome c [Acetonema longum]EGO64982.1 putative fumarate reductase flavoprotein subunit [Acetonema longum DSM 6540]
MDQNLNRRNFIKTTAAAGLAIASAAVLPGCSAATTGKGGSVSWKEEADVVVVGSGFAGLAAAIEAVAAGSSVKVLEKMPISGGNSIINGGDLAAAGTKMQAEAGIKDSVDLMVEDMLKAGSYLNHVEKVRLLAEKSSETVDWTMSLGVKYRRVNFHGGHSVPRAHATANASGGDIVKAELARLKEKGVNVAKNSKVVRLIQNDAGRVLGVEVKTGYKFGDENSGTTSFIKAKKAVVLAAGGFSQDVRMRMIHDPRLTDNLDSTNHAGATGELLREALKLGAMDIHMDWIQCGPWTSPDEKGFGYVPQFCERLVGYAPMVNPKTGKRFIKETGDRKVRADAILKFGYPVVILGDSYAVQRQIVPKILEAGMKNGSVKKYDTLEELARAYEIPVGPFLEEVRRWNSMVLNGKDTDHDCLILEGAKPTIEGPFYAARLWPRVHHTMGGLLTNLKAQVINQDYNPIPGLYAAGEITGGIHGAVRLGSCALTDCLVNGRIAGQEAAREQAWT